MTLYHNGFETGRPVTAAHPIPPAGVRHAIAELEALLEERRKRIYLIRDFGGGRLLPLLAREEAAELPSHPC